MKAKQARSQRLATVSRRPAWQRLHVRIVGLFLGLLLLVQVVGLVALRQSIETRAERQITGDLRTGEAVAKRLMAQASQKYTEGVLLLTSEVGFRAAVTSNDKAALSEALARQSTRLGASLAVFTDKERNLVAASTADATKFLALVRTSLNLRSDAPDAQLGILGGQPYQLISVPVRTPQLVGHVSMSFPFTSDLLQDVAGLSSAKMVLLTRPRGQSAWAPVPLGDAGRAMDPTTPVQAQDGATFNLNQEQHVGRLMPLVLDDNTEVAGWLLRSVDEVTGPYRNLQWTLLQITFWGVVVTAAGSLLMARRVTVPLTQLAASAERLGQGDFTTPVPAAGADEVGDLATSFESMRQAIQAREGQIRQLAYWDPLTGLANRAQFNETAGALVAKLAARGEPCAVLMMDLDRFKLINDVLGPAFGDRVLKRIAARLTEGVLREGDAVARLSGDEFAFCLPGLEQTQAMEVAQRIRAVLERPLTLEDQTVDVSGSIGLAISPEHGREVDLLLTRAEVAMYAAKDRRLGVQAYDPGLDSSSSYSVSLLTELRAALEGGQLQVYFQPKVRFTDGQVIGAEALLRWQHPQRGLVPPNEFIPFAEHSGFVRLLTAWMIEHTAEYANTIAATWPDMKFGVNLSARDLLDQDFPGKVQRLAQGRGMDLSRLTLEITESSIMDDPERSLQILLKLRQLGVRLSIDDFGTGYSSLAYLKRLPLDELKIDRSFVMSMQTDEADVKIVRSTIDLAHNLGLTVVAEGIDSPEAFAKLRALGCDEGQGYRIARPMPAAYFAEWARRWQDPSEQTSTGKAVSA